MCITDIVDCEINRGTTTSQKERLNEMSKFTFTYETRQIMTYEVEADSEEQARAILDQADDMEDFLTDEDYNPDWPDAQPDPMNPEIYVLEEVNQ